MVNSRILLFFWVEEGRKPFFYLGGQEGSYAFLCYTIATLACAKWCFDAGLKGYHGTRMKLS